MSASDHSQTRPQQGQPPLPQGQPIAPAQAYPQAQGYPQAQAYPQAQTYPQGQGYPQAQGYPQGAAYPQAQGYPQGAAYPQAQGYAQAGQAAYGQAGAVAARPVLLQPGAAGTTVRQRQPEKGEEEEETEDVGAAAARGAPPWLISALVHMVALILMALIVFVKLPSRHVQLEAELIYAEKLGDQLEFDSPFAGTDKDSVEEPVWTPMDLPPVEDPFAAPGKAEIVPDGVTSTSDIDSKVIGYALNGREEGSKRAMLGAYGGNRLTEASVQLGLQWLARNQLKDGSWSLLGPYSNGAANENENQVSATAMALLAFQGNGVTHKTGKFKDNVTRGWAWLIKQQDGDGNFFHEGPFNHHFYTQGQCTIALCELYAMTKDEKYKDPALKAIQYLLRSQSTEGGWRYSPNADSDCSVTGWVVMALQSARMGGLDVPDDNLRRVERFLDRIAMNGGSRYPYQKGKEATNTMTAEALLCRQYLGWPRDDARLVEGATWLTQPGNLINFNQGRNVYYWYYATQVMHHMEGDYWRTWNKVMRQVLPEQQVKAGKEAGSWDPIRPSRDEWEAFGGRLYVTCLSIYMLEVYYRHLPLYSKVYTYIHTLKPIPEEPQQPATEPAPGPAAPGEQSAPGTAPPGAGPPAAAPAAAAASPQAPAAQPAPAAGN